MGGWGGPLLENYTAVGFLSNTVMAPLKLPSQHSVSSHHWPSSETLHSCADTESFVRGGPTMTRLFVLLDERREDPNTTKYGQSSARQRKRHLNGVSFAYR